MKALLLSVLLIGVADMAAAQGVTPVGPPGVPWSCIVDAVTAITLCQAVPAGAATGFRNYVTSVACSNEAATVQTVDIMSGTGATCGTNTQALTHKFQMGTVATTTSPQEIEAVFPTPLVPTTAAQAICLRPVNATAFGCTVTGYTAP